MNDPLTRAKNTARQREYRKKHPYIYDADALRTRRRERWLEILSRPEVIKKRIENSSRANRQPERRAKSREVLLNSQHPIHSQETRAKASSTKKSRNLSREERVRIYARIISPEQRKKLGDASRGDKSSMRRPEVIAKLKATLRRPEIRNKISGPNHHSWQGGAAVSKYGHGWTESLKRTIRMRDLNQCQMPKCPRDSSRQALDVHHIDYDKKNLNPSNLITLCHHCHMKTNRRRLHWKKFFYNLMREKKIGAVVEGQGELFGGEI